MTPVQEQKLDKFTGLQWNEHTVTTGANISIPMHLQLSANAISIADLERSSYTLVLTASFSDWAKIIGARRIVGDLDAQLSSAAF
ncbi:hypothetical protein AXG93_3791s1040 [Marchantia polymorpha subsp. ruderalis]|uniref:Uncharacterized protein n=1 Tax=Marchantia polymorpha subsp. ruderalis TaxID=1480154 RepID=A0A176WQU3_MARPO|nr:hypothetical protein AXG93_3791s1040 [Marchantia polymorpha subsp. ruderalis]